MANFPAIETFGRFGGKKNSIINTIVGKIDMIRNRDVRID